VRDAEPPVVERVVPAGHLAGLVAVHARLRRAVPVVLAYNRPDGQVANFDPSKYDPKQAPRLYLPALVNGARVAFESGHRPVAQPIYIGAFVPGTGNEANGMVKATDAGVPAGFREMINRRSSRGSASPGISPAPAAPCCTRAPATSTGAARRRDSSDNLAQPGQFIPHRSSTYKHAEAPVRAPAVYAGERPATAKRSRRCDDARAR